ncbi:MAG: hypothetical protein VXZ72_02115, partial [Chlamydiota bacterium]|nr:hypothetical protein [Chlamydiota bacterium]
PLHQQISWKQDLISGKCTSWFFNGSIESEREFYRNKRQGRSRAWYIDGSLMLEERYDNNRLIEGAYYGIGDPIPLSRIKEGEGTAILHNTEGHFLQKIRYERGEPLPG